jgi:hypothetical protein
MSASHHRVEGCWCFLSSATPTAVFGNLEPCKNKDKRPSHAWFFRLENKGLNPSDYRCRCQTITKPSYPCLTSRINRSQHEPTNADQVFVAEVLDVYVAKPLFFALVVCRVFERSYPQLQLSGFRLYGRALPTTGVLPLALAFAHTVMLLAAEFGFVSFDDVSEYITVSGFAGRCSGCARA